MAGGLHRLLHLAGVFRLKIAHEGQEPPTSPISVGAEWRKQNRTAPGTPSVILDRQPKHLPFGCANVGSEIPSDLFRRLQVGIGVCR